MAAARQDRAAPPKVHPLFSLGSGTFAGAIEGFATYPIEYTKTVSQFTTKAGAKPPNPIVIARDTIAKYGVRGLYSGCGALVAGDTPQKGGGFFFFYYF